MQIITFISALFVTGSLAAPTPTAQFDLTSGLSGLTGAFGSIAGNRDNGNGNKIPIFSGNGNGNAIPILSGNDFLNGNKVAILDGNQGISIGRA